MYLLSKTARTPSVIHFTDNRTFSFIAKFYKSSEQMADYMVVIFFFSVLKTPGVSFTVFVCLPFVCSCGCECVSETSKYPDSVFY